MNILPKKKWHVRTSENIARVRRDEAKAAEEEKELERRSKLAEQESRTSLMRERARKRRVESGVSPINEVEEEDVGGDLPTATVDDSSVIGRGGHVNFFQQLEDGEGVVTTNKEHEEEKKKEQEDYEKKVGYLTYLGQDTEELTGEQVWWKKTPKDRLAMTESDKVKSAVSQKHKEFLDPLSDLRKYLKCDGVRLTMKKHEKNLEKEETKALNFEPVRKKRSRSSSSSRSRSREKRKKQKRDCSHSDSPKHKKHSHRSTERHKKKSKKEKKSKLKRRRESSSSESDAEKKSLAKKNLEKMRRERLERERTEREKANRLVFGEPVVEKKDGQPDAKVAGQRYSSQFNPEFARQNKLDPGKKYWLE